MRMSQDEKSRSRRRIVAQASRLFRQKGVDAASVADVMHAAGMTHGGFYRHFKDKDDLVAEALQAAFDDFSGRLAGRIAAGETAAAVAEFRSLYLSDDHVGHPELGCPIAALAGDISRKADTTRSQFGAWIVRMTSLLSSGLKEAGAERRRRRAVREFAMLVGAVVIARASDPITAADVLQTCRTEDASVWRAVAGVGDPPHSGSGV